MKRELQAFCAGFTWPVVVFLAALAFCVWLTSPVFGDDFDDHLAALKQQNAAAKPSGCDDACFLGKRCTCGQNCPCTPPTEPVKKPHGHADPKSTKSYRVYAMAQPDGSPDLGYKVVFIVSNRDYPLFADSKPFATEKEAQAEADRLNKVDPFAAKNAARKSGCSCDLLPGGCTCTPLDYCESPSCPAMPKLGDRKVTDDPARPFVYGWGDAYGYGHVLGYYRPAAAPPVTYYAPPPAYYQQQAAPRFFAGVACGSGG